MASLSYQQFANCWRRSCFPDFEPMESPPKYIPCKVVSAQGTAACTLHLSSKKPYPICTNMNVALLDVKKAFDTVCMACRPFPEVGITGQALDFIRQWYDHSTSSVLWSGKPSRSINIKSGSEARWGSFTPSL